MRRLLAVLLATTFLIAIAAPAAHAGVHGAARVAIGLAAFAIFAPFIIAGEVLAGIAPYPAPAVVAPPPVYYAPPPAYSAPPPAYYTPPPAYSAPPAYYAPPPAYSAPASAYAPRPSTYPPPPTYSAPPPPIQREVAYAHGKYVLYGDGVRQAWQWVWVPAVPAVPPPPPPPQ